MVVSGIFFPTIVLLKFSHISMCYVFTGESILGTRCKLFQSSVIVLYWLVPFGNILESQSGLKAFTGGSNAGWLLLTEDLQFFRDFIVQKVLEIKLFHGI